MWSFSKIFYLLYNFVSLWWSEIRVFFSWTCCQWFNRVVHHGFNQHWRIRDCSGCSGIFSYALTILCILQASYEDSWKPLQEITSSFCIIMSNCTFSSNVFFDYVVESNSALVVFSIGSTDLGGRRLQLLCILCIGYN